MTNILDYLRWRGDLRMAAIPFNEADGAVFSRIAYFPFHLIGLDTSSTVNLGNAVDAFLEVPDMADAVLSKEDYPLMQALADSPRYRALTLTDYTNTFSAEDEIQFCAVTVKLAENLRVVAFRGTDNTLVGWKEDFNMSFAAPVPAQLLAETYVRGLAERYPGEFILVGHSKGGNLAAYAAMFCPAKVQDRIRSVWSYDGPGFEKQLVEKSGFARVSARMHTLIPQTSIVGMLLEHEEGCSVVHSENAGMMQHDLYSWDVERDRFCHLETVTGGSRLIDATVKEWVSGMSYDERASFVDALYTVLRDTNAQTIREMRSHPAASTLAMLRSLSDMDEKTRGMLLKTVYALLRSAGGEFASWAKEELSENLS